MLSSSVRLISKYTFTPKKAPNASSKAGRMEDMKAPRSFIQRYCTATPPAKGPIGDNDVVFNKFGLEQKTIVEQTMPVVSYCRCWLSATFPTCDGSHKAHNMATGDKTGPLVIRLPKPNP